MRPSPDSAASESATTRRARAWAHLVVWLVVLLAYGAVWTRGVQGDDLCMCELASAHGYWEAVRTWLNEWNSRLFLALTQIGTYHLPWFSDPLRAPWYLLHAMAVLAHLAACGLLLGLLARAGIATGAALAATLIYAIHPVTFEPVLWLAESYGYVLGNLLAMLAVWSYLEYDRSRRVRWLIAACLFALTAVLGIEQYLFVLGALALIHLLGSRWQGAVRTPWLPLLIMTCCTMVFVALHFGVFGGTADRLARATAAPPDVDAPALAWKLAWWLSLIPDASAYGGHLRWGLDMLRGQGGLIASVGIVTLITAWRMTSTSSWHNRGGNPPTGRPLWLFLTGVAIFLAALAPFLFTGRYGFASRNLYVALPGLVIMVASMLDLIATSKALRGLLRFPLAAMVALFVATSLTIDIAAQALFAQSWRFHQEVIHVIDANAESIRAAGALEMTGIPFMPYKAISQIDSGWAFPCLVRWVVGDSEVQAWNNLMPIDARRYSLLHSHLIVWQEN